eukprot:m.134150 g.134150  ORF g.134150 m.134150 type:complete len:87 (+) comp38131_c1_seq13:370-630(+)
MSYVTIRSLCTISIFTFVFRWLKKFNELDFVWARSKASLMSFYLNSAFHGASVKSAGSASCTEEGLYKWCSTAKDHRSGIYQRKLH